MPGIAPQTRTITKIIPRLTLETIALHQPSTGAVAAAAVAMKTARKIHCVLQIIVLLNGLRPSLRVSYPLEISTADVRASCLGVEHDLGAALTALVFRRRRELAG